MDEVTIHILWTVFMFAAFVALVVWLLGGKRKKAFDEAARIPLRDDAPAASDGDATALSAQQTANQGEDKHE